MLQADKDRWVQQMHYVSAHHENTKSKSFQTCVHKFLKSSDLAADKGSKKSQVKKLSSYAKDKLLDSHRSSGYVGEGVQALWNE